MRRNKARMNLYKALQLANKLTSIRPRGAIAYRCPVCHTVHQTTVELTIELERDPPHLLFRATTGNSPHCQSPGVYGVTTVVPEEIDDLSTISARALLESKASYTVQSLVFALETRRNPDGPPSN